MSRQSVEVQTDVDSQSRIQELTALVSQLQDDRTVLVTELYQLKSPQSVDDEQQGKEWTAEHQREMKAAETTGELSSMSDQRWSTTSEEQTQLRQLNEEKLSLQQQLEKISADLQLKEANCLQFHDTVTDLNQQLAVKTSMLAESKDREDDLQKTVEAIQAELHQSECKWHEVIEKKEQLVMELRSDLDALTGSVQRREHMWDSARQSMEQEIETMRVNLNQQTTEHDCKVQVIAPYCYIL